MSDDEIIEVVKARKEGKQIQAVGVCEGDRDINWRDVHLFYWDFQHYNYRVKPEPRKPREWWINPSGDYFDCAYKLPESVGTSLVHVREVIE